MFEGLLKDINLYTVARISKGRDAGVCMHADVAMQTVPCLMHVVLIRCVANMSTSALQLS